jgi:hypothetical protein
VNTLDSLEGHEMVHRRIALPSALITIIFFLGLAGKINLVAAAGSSLVQQNNTGGFFFTDHVAVTVSFPTNVSGGDVVVVDWGFNTTVNNPSVSDSLGSHYAEAVTAAAFSASAVIFYSTIVSNGPDTVTIMFDMNPNGEAQGGNFYVFEVSGVTTENAGTGSGSGLFSSYYYSTNPVVFQSGAFLLGIVGGDLVGPLMAGSGFTVVNGPTAMSAAEYATSGVSSPTNFPATTNSNHGSWSEAGVALPVSPAQATENLINLVNSLGLPHGITNSLDANLNAALESIDSGRNTAARNQLGVFIDEVNAQTGKEITSAQAAQLISAANAIISALT